MNTADHASRPRKIVTTGLIALGLTAFQSCFLLALALRHEAPAALCFSPDSLQLAACGGDWSVTVWNTASGEEAYAVPGRSGESVAAAFSADGNVLRATGSDSSITTWDAVTSERLNFESGGQSGAFVRCFSADGSLLAFVSPLGFVLLHNLASGDDTPFLTQRPGSIHALALRADNRWLACITRPPSTVVVWEVSSAKVAGTWSCADDRSTLAFAPDGKTLALAGSSGSVDLHDPISGALQTSLHAEHGAVVSLAFHPDGARLAAGYHDGAIILWNRADGKASRTLPAHSGSVRAIAFSPDGRLLASVGAERGVRLWNADTGAAIHELHRDERPVWWANLAEAYRRLYRWDVQWYAEISTLGYRSTIPPQSSRDTSNVSFFPGFPLLVRGVHRVTGLPADVAVILAAQLSCWIFWLYFLLLLEKWRIPRLLTGAAVLAVLVHPAAFYLVNGYSEPLFLLGLLGFFYWADRPGWLSAALSGSHGFVMTATRIIGLPLVICPLARQDWRGGGRAQQLRMLSIATVAALGGLFFFAHCQVEFGHWDLYMQTQQDGWKVAPDYFAIFRWRTYIPALGKGKQDDISLVSVPFTAVLFVVLLLREWRRHRERPDPADRVRWELYLAAGLIFYISISAASNLNMSSMIRYNFPVHIFLVLAGVHLLAGEPAPTGKDRWLPLVLLTLLGLASLALQVRLADRYTTCDWVA